MIARRMSDRKKIAARVGGNGYEKAPIVFGQIEGICGADNFGDEGRMTRE
jgi:hypothetical protein